MKGSISEIEKKLQDQLEDPDGHFNKTYTFPKMEIKYTIPFYYHKKKNDDSREKKESKMDVAMSYNPWTGEKLDTEK